MLFSIITPTYNRVALLQRTLESVWAQRFTDYEVIVVDDGSTDGTLEFLRGLGGRVQLLTQTNRGPGSARNAALAVAKGQYAAFIDSDDVWFPWSLALYAEIIDRYKSPVFIAGKPFVFRYGRHLSSVGEEALDAEYFPDYYASSSEWRWWGVSSFTIRRDALLAAGGFLEENINGEDGDLALKLGLQPGFVQVTEPFTFGYREHTGNVTIDLSKTLAGLWHKIAGEKMGAYPGGPARVKDRIEILTREARPVALECLRMGLRTEAWEIYLATLYWHLRLSRAKFTLGFPLKMLMSCLPARRAPMPTRPSDVNIEQLEKPLSSGRRPLFSIIIPTYNRCEMLRKTLESVWAQQFTDYELIIVNNGSTDGTAEFVRGLGARVRLLTQANLGPGVGRNYGAQHANGEYLAFLDSDDLWFPWTLACFAELIQHHERPAILSARLLEFANEAELAGVQESPLEAKVFSDYLASHLSGYFVGAGMSVLRREMFLAKGGYTDRPINAEDHDMVLRLGDAPGFVQITAPVTLGWRRHPGSATLDMVRSVAGAHYLIAQERRGSYPGGNQRRRERRAIVTRDVRPVALACLSSSAAAAGWRLYGSTFGWHTALGCWKFLAGFPMKALLNKIK